MGAPSLTVTVEPSEGSSVVYGPLAAKAGGEATNGQLSLMLLINNGGTDDVHLNQVDVSFVGPPNVGESEIVADLDIPKSETRRWFFATGNYVLLPEPAPTQVKLQLYCDDFDDPAEFLLPLAPYESNVDGGGYTFPARVEDLKEGEYWVGVGSAHSPAGDASQMFGYDLGVRVHNSQNNGWQTWTPGSDVTLNENYRVWGKPIYAMADGVVVQFLDGVQPNTPPNLPSPTPNPVEGNHFYIQHGDDLVVYAHFTAGTLNSDLTSGPNPDGTGAAVNRGQFLGLAGNTGNSSEPHLHIHAIRGTAPWSGPARPLPFRNMYAVDLGFLGPNDWPAHTDTPWSAVEGQSLPSVLSAVWMGALKPGKSRFRRWAEGLAWAWIIFIGGLMITPGGISCPPCGDGLTLLMGILSVVLGAFGMISSLSARAATQVPGGSPQTNVKGDMHG